MGQAQSQDSFGFKPLTERERAVFMRNTGSQSSTRGIEGRTWQLDDIKSEWGSSRTANDMKKLTGGGMLRVTTPFAVRSNASAEYMFATVRRYRCAEEVRARHRHAGLIQTSKRMRRTNRCAVGARGRLSGVLDAERW